MDDLEWHIDEQQIIQEGPLAGWQLRAYFSDQPADSALWVVVGQALGGAVSIGQFSRGGDVWHVVARPTASGARGICARTSRAPLAPGPLLAAYSAQGQVVRTLAHNVNNPLGAICNYASILIADHGDDPPQALEKIASLAFKAADYFKAFRVLISGHKPLSTQPLDTSRWLSDVLSRARRAYPDRHITAEDQGGAFIPANVEALDLALDAALQNAAEATQPAERIHLSASVCTLEADVLAGWPASPGQFWQLRISDTGAGIAPDRIESVLEVFESSHNPHRGMGLPTILTIARQHGGHATIESAPGAGTVLTLSLPLRAPGAARPSAAPRPASASLPARGGDQQSATLLLADDNLGVLSVTSKTLQRAGYTVDEAKDGDEAMELFLAAPDRYDAVLLDDRMPFRSGMALATAMRAARPQLRVLLVTGGAAPFSCPFPVLNKPYRPTQLLSAVQSLLS